MTGPGDFVSGEDEIEADVHWSLLTAALAVQYAKLELELRGGQPDAGAVVVAPATAVGL